MTVAAQRVVSAILAEPRLVLLLHLVLFLLDLLFLLVASLTLVFCIFLCQRGATQA